MASERLVEVPVDAGSLFRPDDLRPVSGGGTRVVKLVPIDDKGEKLLPCIWRSHEVTQGADNAGRPIKVNACLLLASKSPPLVLPAEIEVEAWQNFREGPVEW